MKPSKPTPAAVENEPATQAFEDATYAKVTRRLLPFLILCYIIAYLDRVNVGFANLQMSADLKFSDTVFGLGAGIFFIGYFFFEVPSNIILYRVGARLWIARIMITWGLVSAATMFVETPLHFYGIRFLLGIAEAGFFPGIILYLTHWYPAGRRAKIIASFMVAIPLSGVLGAPFSGFIMQYFAGVNGWPGWKWMFMLEAIPSLIMGVATAFYLNSGIEEAKWLSASEKQLLKRNIELDARDKVEHASLSRIFTDPRVWLMSWIFFAAAMGQYALTFWMPVMVRSAGIKGVLNVGLITAIPYLATAVAMVLLGASADRKRERRWHLALPMAIGGLALFGSVLAGSQTALAVTLLSIAAAGIISSAPLFWSLPTAFLRGASAAAGIAFVNSVGNLAGFASPYMVGFLRDLTHNDTTGMFVLTLILLAGAATVLAVPARLVNR